MGPQKVEAVKVLRIEMDPQVSSTRCQAHAKVKLWINRMPVQNYFGSSHYYSYDRKFFLILQ